jgi:hypothetical protein
MHCQIENMSATATRTWETTDSRRRHQRKQLKGRCNALKGDWGGGGAAVKRERAGQADPSSTCGGNRRCAHNDKRAAAGMS